MYTKYTIAGNTQKPQALLKQTNFSGEDNFPVEFRSLETLNRI